VADASNDLLLSVLRQVQADLSEVRKDVSGIRDEVATIRTDLKEVDQKVNGLTVMFALLAGHVHHIEERVQALETTR